MTLPQAHCYSGMPCTEAGVSPPLTFVKEEIEDDSDSEADSDVPCDANNFVSHQEANAVVPRPRFVCESCCTSFRKKEHYVSHMSKQHATTQCFLCKRKFGRQRDLTRHLSTKHGAAQCFPCHLCPSIFSRKTSLLGHIRRRHSGATKQ
ncbi:zinc finger protein 687a-like isoform X3 [Dermacentor albipictus]|uniref:zinc finger protein 687a-like isoform X3 n=1 Tax=Dermacentor albipictus TaxID=60249 RepID=UPI0038FCE33A